MDGINKTSKIAMMDKKINSMFITRNTDELSISRADENPTLGTNLLELGTLINASEKRLDHAIHALTNQPLDEEKDGPVSSIMEGMDQLIYKMRRIDDKTKHLNSIVGCNTYESS